MGGTLLQKQGDEWVVIGYHAKTPKIGKEFWRYRVRIDRIISEHPQFHAIAMQ